MISMHKINQIALVKNLTSINNPLILFSFLQKDYHIFQKFLNQLLSIYFVQFYPSHKKHLFFLVLRKSIQFLMQYEILNQFFLKIIS